VDDEHRRSKSRRTATGSDSRLAGQSATYAGEASALGRASRAPSASSLRMVVAYRRTPCRSTGPVITGTSRCAAARNVEDRRCRDRSRVRRAGASSVTAVVSPRLSRQGRKSNTRAARRTGPPLLRR
jgi:hypothetical protein